MASHSEVWSNGVGEMTPNEMSQKLLSLYCGILDPNISPQTRMENERIIEEFRTNSPYTVQTGLLLLTGELLSINLGLQLLQHFVRYRWSSLGVTEQLQLREELMQYRIKVGDAVLPLYIKEGMARLIVEMLKKMWPQDWPNFVSEIFTVEDKVGQIELILLIFRRLAEDLLSYDASLTNSRKSVMLTALQEEVTVLTPLFNLFITVFQASQLQDSLCEIAITTLSSFVEWVDLSFLTFKDCQIVLLLLQLLFSSSNHRAIICDCLIGILSRKGGTNIRQFRECFLKVFTNEILLELERCINVSSQLCSSNEEEYMFLKKASQMMVTFGTCQLIPLWESEGFTPPVYLQQYLCVMLLFFSHPSLVMCSTCLEFWSAVIHHKFLKINSIFLNILPQLVQILRDKQLKVGDPSQPLHISSHYSNIDFDGPDEYNIFFSRCKSQVNRLLTDVVSINPTLLSEEVTAAVHCLVTSERHLVDDEERRGGKMSTVFLEWDATCSFIECWVTGLDQCRPVDKEVASGKGVAIVKALLSYAPTSDTSALWHLKALENGLQSFIAYNSDELLQGYLEKILTYAVYPGTHANKLELTREQKQTRLAALYCLINLVKSYAKSLQSATHQLLDHYNKLLSSQLLLYSEKCAFMEAFTILSHFQSDQEQELLIGHLLNETQLLVQTALKSAVSSLSSFIQYLSLDQETLSTCVDNRPMELSYCTHSIMGVLQTSTPRVKRQCGAPEMNGTSSCKHIIPLVIDFILPLIKVLHLLWSDSSKHLLSSSHQRIHSLHRQDKDAILGILSTGIEQDDFSRIYHKLIMSYDQCIMAVGYAWINYGPELLSQVGFMEGLMNNVLLHLGDTNQLRIKPIIKNLIISMVRTCPSSHWQTTLAPILSRFCSITFNCLQTNWTNITQQLAQQYLEEDEGTISDQVIIHQFTVQLTRQYTQLISTICIQKDTSSESEVGGMTEDNGSNSKDKKIDVLSDLAISLFNYDEMQRILMLSVFVPLTWADGISVRKCLNIATVIFDKIPPGQFGEKFIYQIMEQLLLGLRTHGEDSGLCISIITLALHVYESTISCYPLLGSLLANLPESSQERVQSFNRLLTSKSEGAKHVKKKKEEFRKLVGGIIGKPIGQLHKLSPVFLDAPALTIKKGQRLKKIKNHEIVRDLTSLFGDDQT